VLLRPSAAERGLATGREGGRSGEREATQQKGVRWLRVEGGGTTSRALAEALGSRLWRRRSALWRRERRHHAAAFGGGVEEALFFFTGGLLGLQEAVEP
jgi:hypothetical protein